MFRSLLPPKTTARKIIVLLSAFLIFASFQTAFADRKDETKQSYVLRKTGDRIVVDGFIDDPAWQKALALSLDVETSPGENINPPVRTMAFITYDDTHIYIAFRAFDPRPAAIRARISDRDNAGSDDLVGVLFDTFNDERRAYSFMVNPLGVQMDSRIDEITGDSDDTWNAIWDSAGTITEQGYEVEIAIPFNQIRFQRTKGEQTWGFDFRRIYPRSNSHQIGLVPLDRSNDSELSQFSRLGGIDDIKPGRNIEIIPTFTTLRAEERLALPGDAFEERASSADLGLSARWGVSPNISLNGTLNPDFSQVEADAVQLDINETFSIFFPETRPFFLEGADIFENRFFDLVHTRTIADPTWAAKLTGKEGPHTFGLLAAEDDITAVIIPGSQGDESDSFFLSSRTLAGRYRYDFGRNSSVGATLTNRQAGDYVNRVFAIDTTYRLSPSDLIWSTFAGSTTDYNRDMVDSFGLGSDSFKDRAFGARYNHNGRNVILNASYQDIGRDFRTDAGFETQADVRTVNLGGGYRFWGKRGDFFNRITLFTSWDQTKTHDGDLIEEEAEFTAVYRGPLQSRIRLNLGTRERVFNRQSFDQNFVSAFVESTPVRGIYTSMQASRSDWIDFSQGREADQLVVQPRVISRIGAHIFADFRYRYTALYITEGRLFTTHVPQARLIYNFSNRWFLRAILQNVRIDRSPKLYSTDVDASTTTLLSQLLLSYKINPQTLLFLGYADNYRGTDRIDLTQVDRTIFLKLSYAWLQ